MIVTLSLVIGVAIFAFAAGWAAVRVKDALEARHRRWRYRRSK